MTIKTDFLEQLDRFSLIVNKRVTSNYSGARRSIAFGHGLTLKDYRNYVAGDDIRLIDWKLLGRTDKLYVKQYEEDRTLTVYIIIDASASMNFGKPTSKYDYGSMIGAGFAYLAMKENDKFQFSTFSSELHTLRPRRGMSQMVSVIDNINEITAKGASNFEDAMIKLRKTLKGRSLIVLASDFLFPPEEIERGLLRLGKQEIKVIQVLDRVEKELNFEGDVKLYDAESNQILRTFMSKRLREKYQQKLNEHSSKIHDICLGLHASFNQVTSDEPIFDTFFDVLKSRGMHN